MDEGPVLKNEFKILFQMMLVQLTDFFVKIRKNASQLHGSVMVLMIVGTIAMKLRINVQKVNCLTIWQLIYNRPIILEVMRKNIIFLCIFSYTWDSDCCQSKGVSLQCLELCSLSSRIMPEMKPESLLSEDHPFSKCDSFRDIIYQCVGPIKQSRTWGRKPEKEIASGIYSPFFLILSIYFCYTNIIR